MFLAVVLVTSAGCDWVSQLVQAQFPYPSLSPGATTPASVAPSFAVATPAASCPTITTGRVMSDPEWAFRLTMPSTWRNLRPGDEGWVTLYGQHGTDTEQKVIDGEIQDFAVPLDEATRLQITLTVYVDSVYPEDLVAEARAYADVIRRAYRGDAISVDYLTLPAGHSVRVVGTHPDRAEPSWVWRVTAYLIYNSGFRYAVVFEAPDAKALDSAPAFDCIATSLQFLPGGPTVPANRPTFLPTGD